MATAELIEGSTADAPEQETAKRKPGRPKRPQTKEEFARAWKRRAIKKGIDVPVPILEVVTPLEHGLTKPPISESARWIWLNSLPAEKWESELILYLYRRSPYLKVLVKGERHFIAKYSEPLDQQKLMEEHGSGEYLLMLTQTVAGLKDAHKILEFVSRVFNPKYPPNIPPGPWLDFENNIEWQWARPEIEAKAAQRRLMAPTAQPQPAAAPQASSFKDLAEAVDIMRPLEKETTAKEQLGMIETIIKLTKPAESKEGEGMMNILARQLEASDKRNEAFLTRLLAPAPPAPPAAPAPPAEAAQPRKSLREELEDVQAISAMFSKPPAAAAADDNSWTGFGIKALEVLGTALAPIGAALAPILLNRMLAPAPVTLTAARTPGQLNAYQATGSPSTPTGQPTPPSAPQPQQQPTGQEANLTVEDSQLNAQYGPMLDEILPILLDHFINSTGEEFQGWFTSRHGSMQWNVLRNYGPHIERVIKIRQHFPPNEQLAPMYRQLQPEDELHQFVLEFLGLSEVENTAPGAAAQPEATAAAAADPHPAPPSDQPGGARPQRTF